MMLRSKNAAESKTIIFNIIMALVAGIVQLAEALQVNPGVIPVGLNREQVLFACFCITVLGNVVLRAYTNQPLKGTPGEARAKNIVSNRRTEERNS